ncbi:MAG: imidazole glycerol phosphate synthase subunit HisH [Lachnospiraceae bacterium]|nr:imidazole glycerol phosphate synthase subunit HisH [Lachnospiraceae bacterium]
MSKIAVIDYDAGNTMSVMNALKFLGYEVTLSNIPEELYKADHVIFPGVGAYADSMNKLREYGLVEPIKEIVAKKTPFLGICLGMQLIFNSSTENAGDLGVSNIEGLGLLNGIISGFKENPDFMKLAYANNANSINEIQDEKQSVSQIKVPHMGWNSLNIQNKDSKLFRGIYDGSYVYFVHSFYLNAKNHEDVAATTEYGITFDSAVEHDNIFGCQFHPEKSGDVGMEILKNFCSL